MTHRYFLLVIGHWKLEGWRLWHLVPNPGKGNPSCMRWRPIFSRQRASRKPMTRASARTVSRVEGRP